MIVSSELPGWTPQYWQVVWSRLKTFRRQNVTEFERGRSCRVSKDPRGAARQDQTGRRHPEQRPGEPRQRVVCERRTGGDLVRERQREGRKLPVEILDLFAGAQRALVA